MGAQTAGALVVGDVVRLGLVGTNAGEVDCVGIQTACVVALEGVTGKHAEAFGEGFEGLLDAVCAFSRALPGYVSICYQVCVLGTHR